MVDAAWEEFLTEKPKKEKKKKSSFMEKKKMPKCSDLYISTKTIITYLDNPLNLKELFPKIPLINYHDQNEGVIKKTMKYNFNSKEERDKTLEILKKQNCFKEKQLKKKMEQPFKDIRKISLGLCNKDIISYRTKSKGAFYNCFVLILRIFYNNEYKECHVKLFNTGKAEIPGIKKMDEIEQIKIAIIKMFNNLNIKNINFTDSIETVLINSNFNCGYCIDRDVLSRILKDKYALSTSYDPCSYPGIMCKFYYNTHKNIEQLGIEPPLSETKMHAVVSFMIFRTGSILIVGKCSETVLYYIYNYIIKILKNEYLKIFDKTIIPKKTNIKKKIRKKYILISKT